MARILIGGDVCPVGRNELLFRQGRAEVIFNDLLPEFEKADFSIVNLECPLIERHSPIKKDGAVLGVSATCVHGFVAAGIDAVNLANNHILDHGESGLRSTLFACKNAGIDYLGAGANRNEAGRVLIREIAGCKVGFLGVAEHEFSIAGVHKWGANPLDVIEIVRTMRGVQERCDFLIVLVHGGKEHYSYPSPRLQQFCRFIVEEGAGAVICQHSHCAGCYEYYMDAPIVYGQGNLIFDPPHRRDMTWHKGLLVSLDIQGLKQCKVSFKPYFQALDAPGAVGMAAQDAQAFLDEFEKRSGGIKVDSLVQTKWLEYCRQEKYVYASRIRGHNRLLRVVNRRLHFSDWFYSRTTKLIQRNVVECEIHREALETLWHDPETDF